MKRFTSSVVMALFLLSVPAFAAESNKQEEKEAVKQCKVEFSQAKKAAGEKKTHKERSDAKKEAKSHYKECVEKAKHKS